MELLEVVVIVVGFACLRCVFNILLDSVLNVLNITSLSGPMVAERFAKTSASPYIQ